MLFKLTLVYLLQKPYPKAFCFYIMKALYGTNLYAPPLAGHLFFHHSDRQSSGKARMKPMPRTSLNDEVRGHQFYRTVLTLYTRCSQEVNVDPRPLSDPYRPRAPGHVAIGIGTYQRLLLYPASSTPSHVTFSLRDTFVVQVVGTS
jgi:hypothetical protein